MSPRGCCNMYCPADCCVDEQFSSTIHTNRACSCINSAHANSAFSRESWSNLRPSQSSATHALSTSSQQVRRDNSDCQVYDESQRMIDATTELRHLSRSSGGNQCQPGDPLNPANSEFPLHASGFPFGPREPPLAPGAGDPWDAMGRQKQKMAFCQPNTTSVCRPPFPGQGVLELPACTRAPEG